jgi:hypothetical protein
MINKDSKTTKKRRAQRAPGNKPQHPTRDPNKHAEIELRSVRPRPERTTAEARWNKPLAAALLSGLLTGGVMYYFQRLDQLHSAKEASAAQFIESAFKTVSLYGIRRQAEADLIVYTNRYRIDKPSDVSQSIKARYYDDALAYDSAWSAIHAADARIWSSSFTVSAKKAAQTLIDELDKEDYTNSKLQGSEDLVRRKLKSQLDLLHELAKAAQTALVKEL